MLKGIAARTAVVTGAAGGIGSATVRRLHAEGANVVAVDLDKGPIDALAAELGERIIAVQANVSSPDDTEMFMRRAVDTFETVDMFHANAGVESKVIPVAAFDIDDVVFGLAPQPDLDLDARRLLDEFEALESKGAVGVAQDLAGQLVDAGGLGVEAGLRRGGRLLHTGGVRCCQSAFKYREMRHRDAKGAPPGGRRDA